MYFNSWKYVNEKTKSIPETSLSKSCFSSVILLYAEVELLDLIRVELTNRENFLDLQVTFKKSIEKKLISWIFGESKRQYTGEHRPVDLCVSAQKGKANSQ